MFGLKSNNCLAIFCSITVLFCLFISLSVFSAWGNFCSHVFGCALEACMAADVIFRRGLPCNMLCLPGGHRGSVMSGQPSKNVEEKVTAHLEEVLGHVNIQMAMQSYSMDFITSRLPPPGSTRNCRGIMWTTTTKKHSKQSFCRSNCGSVSLRYFPLVLQGQCLLSQIVCSCVGVTTPTSTCLPTMCWCTTHSITAEWTTWLLGGDTRSLLLRWGGGGSAMPVLLASLAWILKGITVNHFASIYNHS